METKAIQLTRPDRQQWVVCRRFLSDPNGPLSVRRRQSGHFADPCFQAEPGPS